MATLRHRRGVRWITLAKLQHLIWREMTKQSFWRDRTLAHLRQDEATEGANGFHPHAHVLSGFRPGTDLDEVRDWVEAFWKRRARHHGRTAEWHDGWWSPVAHTDLTKTARYALKHSDGSDLAHVAAAEVLGGSGKIGSALWDLSPASYVEVWHDSANFRWYDVGGLLKTPKTAALVSEEEIAKIRERMGMSIARVLRSVWRKTPIEKRTWLVGLMSNREISDAEFLASARYVLGAENILDASNELGMDEAGAAGVLVSALAADE